MPRKIFKKKLAYIYFVKVYVGTALFLLNIGAFMKKKIVNNYKQTI